ncbi:hypothetical protein [Cohnella thailandensis]|uniref:Uncharacterized protein n=1 Tax=Cohnella thailandensis TaxID=557557 RepID=A0A841SMV3_9BACL|nr:hypothetical protein [Cohnella thailandensis]MBB6633274.1 hypothetical protein [Cohnella thailandensis]MBP1975028.1 hypothetical protein [Cohnella thailandensis]
MAARRKIGIPAARSGKWLLWGACGLVLYSALLMTIRFGILGQVFTFALAFRFVLLGGALALVSALAGWLGARLLSLAFAAGVLAGLLAMVFYVTKDADGWEDLVSLLTFLELSMAGLALGIVAELVALAIRKRRR